MVLSCAVVKTTFVLYCTLTKGGQSSDLMALK